jgi:signal transduction histidine kinase
MSAATTPVSRGPRGRPRFGARAGIVASARGLAFCGLMLAGAGLLLALAVALALNGLGILLLMRTYGTGPRLVLRVIVALAVTLVWLGVSRILIPRILLAVRELANLTRRLAQEWCGVPIAVPGLLPPGGREISLMRRFGWLLSDAATWRDMLWLIVNACVGWVLAAAPAGLVALGLIGFIGPTVNPPIAIPPPAFPGNTKPVLVLLGVAFIALGLWAAPWLLRAYGGFARLMLAPAGQAELELRLRHLALTRSETIDTGAAEMRRIERDLHDGAQARLVAMGMTLDAAGQVLDENPDAARALLAEARDASVKALAELRDLVRGIHPPVLADRGLADAIRALALDSPLRTHLVSDLPGRPPAAVESAAYFAVSELLANVSKHAGADQAWIDIRHAGGMLRIGVTDDGRGGADPAHGTGLRGIERRLAAFDGVLAVSSPLGGPTAVTMEIPCALSSPKTSSC